MSSGASSVHLFRRDAACRVLGPGVRAVLWVQGCSLACRGCLVPQSWAHGKTSGTPVEEIVAWMLGCPDIEGVTLSGGEPMQQAAALAAVVEGVRAERDLGVVCYTGYRLEELVASDQQALLRQVDLLIDGRYQADLHADLLWRGSSNQRLMLLSDRYRNRLPDDRGVGLEYQFHADGSFTFAGVPPWPQYVQSLPTS